MKNEKLESIYNELPEDILYNGKTFHLEITPYAVSYTALDNNHKVIVYKTVLSNYNITNKIDRLIDMMIRIKEKIK